MYDENKTTDNSRPAGVCQQALVDPLTHATRAGGYRYTARADPARLRCTAGKELAGARENPMSLHMCERGAARLPTCRARQGGAQPAKGAHAIDREPAPRFFGSLVPSGPLSLALKGRPNRRWVVKQTPPQAGPNPGLACGGGACPQPRPPVGERRHPGGCASGGTCVPQGARPGSIQREAVASNT